MDTHICPVTCGHEEHTCESTVVTSAAFSMSLVSLREHVQLNPGLADRQTTGGEDWHILH